MKSDSSDFPEENVLFFSNEHLALCEVIKTMLLYIDENISYGSLMTVYPNFCLQYLEQRWQGILCKKDSNDNDKDNNNGSFGYEGSVRASTDGGVQASGGLDYTQENSNSSFSIGVDASVQVSPSGEVSVEAGISGKGKF